MFAYFAYNFVVYTIILGLTYIVLNINDLVFEPEFSELKPEYENKLDKICYFVCNALVISVFAFSLVISVTSALGMILIVIASFL